MTEDSVDVPIAARTARRLLARLDWAAKPADEQSEAARDEAQRLLLARHLARDVSLKARELSPMSVRVPNSAHAGELPSQSDK